MTAQTPTPRLRRLAALAGAAACALAPAAFAQGSGDRQLLRTNSGDPYLMVLFDNSASMNWASTCSAQDIADGKCNFLCTTENCPVPMGGDDPNSKLYQAKEALYNAMLEVEGAEDIYYGFASLNQDNLAVGAKHWLYTVKEVDASGAGAVPSQVLALFAVGTEEVFGAIAGANPGFDYGCDRYQPATDNSGTGFDANLEVGCYHTSTDAAAVSGGGLDAWKTAKLHRLPKGGALGTTPVTYHVKTMTGNTTTGVYSVTIANGADYDSVTEFDTTVTIGTGCVAGVCTPVGTLTVTYERTSDTSFFFWEGVLRKNRNATDLTKVAYLGGYPDSKAPDYDTLDNATGTDGVYWATDLYAQETCRGWDPSGTSYPSNSDETEPFDALDTDPFDSVNFAGYNLRFLDDGYTFDLTGTDWEAYQYLMLRGDVIPLDWLDRNYDRVLTRLNPLHDPDSPGAVATSFKQAAYYADDYAAGEGFLRLKDETVRPILGHGLTPLAGWYSFFRSWYSGCGKPGNCDGVGWSDIAAAYDPDFACRKKYVLMLTDGGETCDGSPQLDAEDYYDDNETLFPPGFEKGQNADQCRYRASMAAQEEVESLVIGFGVENREKLQCANTPVVFVSNKEELFDEIKKFLGQIQEQAASFASAAVPTVQANIADKVYLSSFIPLNDASVWPGRLDAYLKPLPLDPDTGLPDRDKDCAVFDVGVNQSECFAWDAGDSQLLWNTDGGWDPQGLLAQAPFPEDLDGVSNSKLLLGAGTTGADKRRVFFGLPDADPTSVPSKMQWFQYPADGTLDNTEQVNYEYAWNLPVPPLYDDTDAQYVANRAEIAGIIDFTLAQKRAEIDNAADPLNPFHIQYLMGDIFHSNPLVLNPPADFEFYTKDLYWGQALCGDADAETTANRGAEKLSYNYYSNKNLCRRVMIFAGSDDAQLHAFDAGMFQGDDCQLPLPSSSPAFDDLADLDGTDGAYDYGTGREMFSFIPQAMMPLVKELSEIDELTTQYGVDGTMRVADVFIDPVPAADGTITCAEREWRTVLLGHYREGGPGVFALDITQPDILENTLVPRPAEGSRLSNGDNYVPSCTPEYGQAHDPECGPLPFPALKWEFRDLDAIGAPADDDGNLETDLAEGWSRPLVVRMQVCLEDCDDPDAALVEDRYVAIFGGGIPSLPRNSMLDDAGDWLYMVDVESGELLYKRGGYDAARSRQIITGSVATDITGVDENVDGLVDTLYFGTTAGYVYKVALGDGPFELGTDETDPTTYGRIIDPLDDEGDSLTGYYDPFIVFSTLDRPIYLEINAVYVPKMGSYAILFGTGNRSNLWDFTTAQTGRFFNLLDQNWVDSNRDGVLDNNGGSPLTEANYTLIDPDDLVTPLANYLFGEVADGKEPGWYFTLDTDEKLITEAFTLSGVSFFTVFHPLKVESTGPDPVCAYTGESKIFVVNTVTTKGYAVQEGTTERTRYVIAPTFTTQPFVEQSLTQNAPTTSQNNADTWTEALAEVNADLKKLFPPGARFASYTLDIKTIRSDTGIVFVAPVPVAIEPHNWKEF